MRSTILTLVFVALIFSSGGCEFRGAQEQALSSHQVVHLSPEVARVNSYHPIKLVLKIGSDGIAPDGRVRFLFRHLANRSMKFQTTDEHAIGYVTVNHSYKPKIRVYFNGRHELVSEYFPWQNILEFQFEEGVPPNEEIEFVLGSNSSGNGGVKFQLQTEKNFKIRVLVEQQTDNFVEVNYPNSIQIVHGEAYLITTVSPSKVKPGEPFKFLVRIEDRYGNRVENFDQQVHINSSVDLENVPSSYHFSTQDRGTHVFNALVTDLATQGSIAAKSNGLKTTANKFLIEGAAETGAKLFWGDLHGHSINSDGRGSSREYFDYAKEYAFLDFCALTDHGFNITQDEWKQLKDITNEFNVEGEFVTLNAYEWSGLTENGGDHNIFFRGSDPPLLRSRTLYHEANADMYHGSEPQANHIVDVYNQFQNKGETEFVSFPHYGGRPANAAWHNLKFEKGIEVYSEHENSLTWGQQFLDKGYKMGLAAGTDTHFGKPGYGFLFEPIGGDAVSRPGRALTGVYSDDLSRESIFDALKNRQFYATTGDRIVLKFALNGHPMGSILHKVNKVELSFMALAVENLERIQIYRDNQVISEIEVGQEFFESSFTDTSYRPGEQYFYYLRVIQSNKEEAVSSPIWVE